MQERSAARIALVVIQKDALGRSIEIIILAAAQRPQEGDQADGAEEQRHRNEIDEDAHAVTGSVAGSALPAAAVRPARIRRSALVMTRMDEPDMAMAAISGVT